MKPAMRPLHVWRRLSLLVRFTLTGLALTVVIGLVLGVTLGRQIERSALEQEADNAADSVPLLLDPFLRREDFDVPLTAERYAAIHRLIRDRVLQSHIVRIKIWNAAGTVIYCDDPMVVGGRDAGGLGSA